MKANEFTSMSKEQLTEKVAELKKDLFTLRFQLATGQLQNTMQAQGMAVDADVLSAAASLSSGQSQLNTLDAGIEQICKMLCSFTGYDEASNPVFG